VEIREALPKNAAGKILKRELRLAGERERGVALPPVDRGPLPDYTERLSQDPGPD
jgi:hypothetical protein